MKNRITPTWITSIKPSECFVFGANLAGRNGAGAAKIAMKWGAMNGLPFGPSGQTFAIPTKSFDVKYTLSLPDIEMYVSDFIAYAKEHYDTIFLVTEIGCGLAGLSPEEVAPLFKEAVNVENIHMPLSFWNVLNGEQ